MHIDAADGSEDVAEAIRATAADTEDAFRDTEEDEAMTRQALDLLNSQPLRARDGGAARGHATMVGRHASPRPRGAGRGRGARHRRRRGTASLSRGRGAAVVFEARKKGTGPTGRSSGSRRSGEVARPPDKLGAALSRRYEVHLDRRLERTLAMLLRLKDLRQGAIAG